MRQFTKKKHKAITKPKAREMSGASPQADVAPSTIPRLPPEILDIIISMLHADRSTLLRLSLVSVDFVAASRSHVFRNLILQIEELGVFLRIINVPQCTLARYVRTLQFLCIGSPRSSLVIPGVWENGRLKYNVGKIPRLLPNVSSLYLDGFPLHRMSQKLRRSFCAGFGKMETLVVGNMCGTIPGHSFFGFVQWFPNIRKLVCEKMYCWRFGATPEDLPNKAFPVNLNRLVLMEPSESYLSFLMKSLSLRNIQRLSIEIGYSMLNNAGDFLKEIGPSLIHFQLNLDNIIMHGDRIPVGGWELERNVNLDTLVLHTRGIDFQETGWLHPWIPRLLSVINPPRLRKLVLLYDLPINEGSASWSCSQLLDRVLESRREMLEGLGEFWFMYGGGLVKGHIARLFDPEGRRGWKQKGIPQVKLIPDTGRSPDDYPIYE